MDLAGRIAILTGPGKGMGPAIAETLAREGADLLLCGRDLAPIEAVAETVRKLGRRAVGARCDVTDPAAVEAMAARTREVFGGRIDILVNAAGGTGPVEKGILETDPAQFDDVVAVNMRGCFLTIRAVLPTMIEQRYGKIVNIGGTWGLRGKALRMAYGATKWGLRGIAKSAALEAGPYNVNVNNVCPGIVEGPRFDNTCRVKAQAQGKSVEQVRAESAAEYALRRLSTAQDVANVVAFLCSDKSRQITGQDIAVDGGWVI
ncbi:MAG TPA: SDR family NAD(P)-dependent oxidoreductase [Alphaproteobacteria bacterium]|nr:SDR family NAD(P)-dependent oxidoreductase [Alphaproteobacteria bacterium]